MSIKYLVVGTRNIELAGHLCPLCIGYGAVEDGKIVAENLHVLDWTQCYPGPGDQTYRSPPPGGARLTDAEWRRALKESGVPLGRPTICKAQPPRQALAFLYGRMVQLKQNGLRLVIHSAWPDLNVLTWAIENWLEKPTPDVVAALTGHLELAARLGMRRQLGEEPIDFTCRIEGLPETPAPLEECLRRRRLDPSLPPDHPLYRIRGTHLLYQDLLPYYEGGAVPQGSQAPPS